MSRRSEQRRGSIPPAGSAPGGPGRQGLTQKQVQAAVHAQHGACAVCGRPLPAVPVIDHDHRKAATHPHPVSRGCQYCFRGVLCGQCNLMLGNARDDPETLRAGAVYVELRR